MAAYVISEVEILDEQAANHYRSLAAESIGAYDGRYVVRGAECEVHEGPPTQKRLVIVEFPSMRRAKEWYSSAEYAKALQFKDKALRRRLTFVEGVI